VILSVRILPMATGCPMHQIIASRFIIRVRKTLYLWVGTGAAMPVSAKVTFKVMM